MEALNAKPDDAMGCDSISDRDEADTTGIVVLQRVVERKSVHMVASVGSVEGISCECFHKIETVLASISTLISSDVRDGVTH